MKIKYINEVDYCCNKMKETLNKDCNIGYLSDEGVCIINPTYKLYINFCPFCGEKIEFIK